MTSEGVGDNLLRALFDNVLDAVALFDGAGRFVRVNEVVARVTGYDVDELSTMTLQDVLPLDGHANLDEVWEQFLASGHLRGDAHTRRRDGSIGVIDYRLVANIRPGTHLLLAQDVTERRQTESSERFQAQLLESVGEAVVATDLDGRIRYWNRGAERLWGWREAEVLGRPVDDVNVPDDRVEDGHEIRDRALAGESWRGEFLTHDRDGTDVPVLATNEVYVDATGAPVGVIAIARDVTALKQTERLLDRRAQQQHAVAELGHDALRASDPGAVRQLAVRTIEEVFARTGHPTVVVTSDDATAPGPPGEDAALEVVVASTGDVTVRRGERQLDAEDQEFLRGVANVVKAFEAQHRFSRQLDHVSTHDRVTGLVNRGRLLEHIDLVHDEKEAAPEPFVVMALDVDRFRAVNNGLGHEAGDDVLHLIGARLQELARPGDVVASLGADRFAVLCPDVPSTQAGVEVAEQMRRGFEGPLWTPYGELAVTISVGLVHTCGTTTAVSLLRDADTALDWAKDNGRNRVEVFDAGMLEQALYGFNTTLALRRALQGDGIRVVYQPTVELATGRVVGVEALARLELPNGTVISPAQFIPVAERSGLVTALGERVLDRACRDVAQWLAVDPTLVVSVNVSPRQLGDRRLVEAVRDRLADHGVPPAALCLEITESALLSSSEALATLHDLHDLGVSLAIDDFGTGFSSLSQLRLMPVDILKIDKSFVGGVDRQGHDRTLVTAAIDIARAFELTTIAEGVETEGHRGVLVGMGCSLAQGYLWSRPTDPGTIAAMLWEPLTV